MGSEIITTRTGKVGLGEDGILRGVSLSNARMTLADAQENIAAGHAVDGGIARPVLMDIRQIQAIDWQARAFFASETSVAHSRAVALLIGTPVSRMIGNFFLVLNKPRVPLRLFTDEGEAIEWLKGFLP